MVNRVIFFLIFLWSLSSCDCIVSVHGKILSNSTKRPVAGATIEMVGENIKTLSGPDGGFHLEKITGFCFDPHIRINMEHYKPFEMTRKSPTGQISYDVKSELELVRFDQPFYPDSSRQGTFLTGISVKKFSGDFAIVGDTIIFYLDTLDFDKEIKTFKSSLRHRN